MSQRLTVAFITLYSVDSIRGQMWSIFFPQKNQSFLVLFAVPTSCWDDVVWLRSEQLCFHVMRDESDFKRYLCTLYCVVDAVALHERLAFNV